MNDRWHVGCAGLPIGFQIAGRTFDEAIVLLAAHAYGQAVVTRWAWAASARRGGQHLDQEGRWCELCGRKAMHRSAAQTSALHTQSASQ
jgi:hypothetical protein